MGRRERIGSKKNREGRIRERNSKSDDSDEDYMLEEDETDDQSDELDSLVNDVSDEESLGNFVNEEEEENVTKVVRKKSCKRSMRRGKNGTKSAKRKRITDDEEDDEDYEVEEEEEEEEEEDVDCIDGGGGASLDRYAGEEEEEKIRKVARPKSRKTSSGQRRNGVRSFGIRKRMPDDEEEDDEDYEEDNDVEADSFDDVSVGSFVDEEEEENSRKVVRTESGKRSTGQRGNGTTSSRKRNDEVYDDEEENDDNGVDSIDGSDHRVCAAGSVGHVSDDDDDEEYDFEDDNDDDDDEFTPEELEFLDEEEDPISPKGKKDSVRSQKRKTGAKLLKRPQKNKKQGRSRSSKVTSSRSRKSVKRALSVRGRCKRRSIHRKKKAKPCSDSDFAVSEPSDYDFTISEEEREQVREANEFCKRQRSKQDEQDIAVNQLKKFPRRKGKEKVEEEMKSDVGKPVCGICLTEEGKNTIRGTLDCCVHFFCFPCIMEWSKVESRCPLCKQRFYTISKPARSSTRVDLRNVVIHVPERDQVYQPSEEELRDYLDSYENVFCTECHEGGDDDLMLLCDLCNSPSHTYCVGLGREVPDGNWYCEGCRPTVLVSTTSQTQDLTPPQRLNNNSSIEPTFENMAEIDLNITIPETPITPVNEFFTSPRQIPASGVNPQAPSPVSGVGVSTLFGRRRVHRLQYLRSSSRLSQMAVIVDRATQSSSIETPTVDVGTSYTAEYVDRLHENPISLGQNRESFPGRLSSLMRGQPQAFQAPSVADISAYNCNQVGRVGNLELNYATGREFLQPCTSRLNLGFETSTSTMLNQNVLRQQVHTLVKGHLKNLCRDANMELGEDTFKQITVCSTHTILAACGLEHSRTEVREIQPPICQHSEALNGSHTSLIKGCCHGCFNSFVMDVVMTIFMDDRAKVPEQLSFRNY